MTRTNENPINKKRFLICFNWTQNSVRLAYRKCVNIIQTSHVIFINVTVPQVLRICIFLLLIYFLESDFNEFVIFKKNFMLHSVRIFYLLCKKKNLVHKIIQIIAIIVLFQLVLTKPVFFFNILYGLSFIYIEFFYALFNLSKSTIWKLLTTLSRLFCYYFGLVLKYELWIICL